MEIHIQPVLPAPRLLVFGVSPTAQALARLAKAMGYTVWASIPTRTPRVPGRGRLSTTVAGRNCAGRSQTRRRLFAVVATQGSGTRTRLGGARPRARLSRRRRQPRSASADAGDAPGARASPQPRSTRSEPGRPRHRRPRAGGDRAQHPGRDRQGAARGRSAAEPSTSAPPHSVEDERDPVCGMTVSVARRAPSRRARAAATSTSAAAAAASGSWPAPERYARRVTVRPP